MSHVYRHSRSKYFYLSYVSVATILMHGDNADLQKERAQDPSIFGFERDCDPSYRFLQFDNADLYQVVKCCSGADRHFFGSVALVQGVVQVEGDFRDRHLLLELYVDEVGLPTVGLPVCLLVVVS